MKKIFLSMLALSLFASTAVAQIANPDALLPNDPSVRSGKLDNGMTYYIQHNDKPAQRADFYLATKVGAIQESPAQDGLAHFLEHMALNGTKNLPGKMMLEYFQSVGVEFGYNINASTGVEQTMYLLEKIPMTRKGILDTALLIMHDYAAFVTNDPKEVENERGVIVEEWRTRRVAAWRMHEKELPYLYKGSKYAGCTLIGDKHNLETFDPQEIVKFYTTWYRPDLQGLVIVGDIDVDAVEAQIKELFADIPAKVNPEPKVMHQIPDNEEPIIGIITDPEATNTSVALYLKRDPIPMEFRGYGKVYLNDMVYELINDMMGERLNDIASQGNPPFIFAGTMYGSFCQTKDAAILQLASKDDQGLNAFKAALTEIEKARRYGFTEAEFDRAVTNMLRGLEESKDNAESRHNNALVRPLLNNFFFGNPYMTPASEYEVAKGYSSLINVDVINQILPQFFDYSKNAVVIYKSVEKEGLVHPTEAQFAEVLSTMGDAQIEAPAAEEAMEPLVDEAALKGSKVKKVENGQFGSTVWTLSNGIKVVVKPTDFKKNQVVFYMSNQGGESLVSNEDLYSLEGNVMYLYSGNAGISKFPQTKLNKMLTGKVVSVSPYIGQFEQGVEGSASTADFETMLQMAYLYYTAPRFNADEFQPGMDQLKAVVPNIIKQPNFVFQSEYTKILYGNNPRMFSITPEMLDKVSITTIERVYKKLFANAAGSTVIIVGDINIDTIKPLVEKYIGSIPTAKKAPKWVDPKTDIVKGNVKNTFEVEMATPKTTVGIVVSGKTAFNLENTVYNSAINYILDLIYTKTIREEEGGTYGVQSWGSIKREPKASYVLNIRFDTDPQKAEKLIQLAYDGLKSLAEEGPSDDYTAKAKENLLKNVPENRINNGYWENCLNTFYKYHVDLDTDYQTVVNGITKEKLQAFAKSIISQGNNVEIVMVPKK